MVWNKMCFISLIRPVKECSAVITAYLTVGDRHILCRSGKTQAERTFQTNAIVPGRINAAVGYPDVTAAVYIDPIAVGVHFQVVDGKIVNAGSQNTKVAAIEDAEILKNNIPAEFQGNSFISNGRPERAAPAKTLAEDKAGAKN